MAHLIVTRIRILRLIMPKRPVSRFLNPPSGLSKTGLMLSHSILDSQETVLEVSQSPTRCQIRDVAIPLVAAARP
jgi:hypothetical protein